MPMLVTLSGIVRVVRLVQSRKAESLMLVPLVITISAIALLSHCFATAETALEGPVILIKFQPENAILPTLVTLSGITMLVKPMQP